MPRRRTRPVEATAAKPRRRKVKRKLSIKRLMMFVLFLVFLFIGSFLISSGDSIVEEKATQQVEEQLAKAENAAREKLSSEVEVNPSTWTRVGRMIFITSEVQEKLRENNHYVTLDKIPESLQQAVISVEDGRFYDHWGFDVSGIIRASLVNLQYGEVKEGASTITQQLVKNMFLSQEQSFGRKAEELLLAIDMEMHYSKQEILEMYLNSIYFGSGYYGITEAAEGYFDKRPDELSLAEASMLAGVPNAPSLYSPYVDFILAKKRQIIVLDAMVKNGYLRDSVAEDAKIKPIYLAH